MNHFHFPSHRHLETISFYEGYFGFRKLRQLGKAHILVGMHGFLLAIDEKDRADTLPSGIHLGFRYESPEKVQKLFKRMSDDGEKLSDLLTPSERATHFYCEDPNGNKIEVGWYEI